jgi:hypothetical protein
MKIVWVTIWVLVLFCGIAVSGQNAADNIDKTYGLDPMLYNGILYTFRSPAGASGNQYLDDRNFMPGSVSVKGIHFDSLLLNYDAVNQQLLMRFRHLNGTTSILVLNPSYLDYARFNHREFIVLKAPGSGEPIYQAIGNAETRVLFAWWKVLSASNSYGESNMVYSKPHRSMYVQSNGRLQKFKNNRSFVACFPKAQQAQIKKHLRQQGKKVRKISDAEFQAVVDYCNSL